MEIAEAKDKAAFNKALAARKDIVGGQFLQSWEWGEFQRRLGRKIFRLVAVDKGEIWITALAIKHKLPLGQSYLYCPRDAVIRLSNHKFYAPEPLFRQARKLTAGDKVIFMRIEPAVFSENFSEVFQTVCPLYTGLNMMRPAKSIQPKDTWILDLARPEGELLAGMHPKTRYNIRLAEKKGVVVRSMDGGSRPRDTEEFLNLLKLTAKRDQFHPHPLNYYRQLMEHFIPSSQGFPAEGDKARCFARVYLAEYKGKILAANFMMFFGNTVTYLHGVSGNEDRNVMAPYLLHWQIIREVKKMGYDSYDFWGIAPPQAGEDHPWAGITRFKKGFGGRAISYMGAFDLVFNPLWYGAYKIAKIIRGIAKRF